MMKPLLFTVALTAALLSAAPTLAQTAIVVNTNVSTTSSIVPQASALALAFPNEVIFDVRQDQPYPLTLILTQPLLDDRGTVVAPANSPVSAILEPHDDGARIVAQSIVVNGQVVPIQAASPIIPSHTITQRSGNQQARETAPVLGNLGASIAGAFGGNTGDIQRGSFIGAGLGILSGLTSPRSVRVVQIPRGSVYVLSLQSSLLLPFNLGVNQQTTTTTTTTRFSFRNVNDYSNGLEQIIRAYNQGQMTRSQAIDIIRAADEYATMQLAPRLFPPAGLRQRVHQLFEFRYAIDL